MAHWVWLDFVSPQWGCIFISPNVVIFYLFKEKKKKMFLIYVFLLKHCIITYEPDKDNILLLNSTKVSVGDINAIFVPKFQQFDEMECPP